MVTNRSFPAVLIVTYCLWSAVALADPGIQSVRVASETTIRAKPCAPVFVALEVTLNEPADNVVISKVLNKMARQVVVNGREYGFPSQSISINPVGAFLVDELWVRSLGDRVKSFPVLVMLYWNMEEQDYVFNSPDIFRIRFYPQGAVDVIVDEPSDDEQNVIVAMKDMGIECARFVMGEGAKAPPAIVSRVEEMVQQYPNTAYAEYLTVCLGLNRLSCLHHGRYGDPDFDPRRFAAERVSLAKKYFEPSCTGAIRSPFDSAAKYHLAEALLNELRLEQEHSSPEGSKKEGRREPSGGCSQLSVLDQIPV